MDGEGSRTLGQRAPGTQVANGTPSRIKRDQYRLFGNMQRRKAVGDALEHGVELRGLRHLEIHVRGAGASAQQRLIALDYAHRIDLDAVLLDVDARGLCALVDRRAVRAA